MQTRALEVRSRDVRLGRRRLKVGPVKVAWGGAWYRVAKMSAAQIEQFKTHAIEHLNQAAGSLEELARVMLAGPIEIVRVMAPVFVDGPIDPRHLARASAEELMALAKAIAEINDFPALLLVFAEEVSLLSPTRWSAFSSSPTITGATPAAPKEN